MKSTTLKTAAEVALAKSERPYRQAQRRENWAKRLDPAAYVCSREGDVWTAENQAAGQRFEFRKELDGVSVQSQSGSEYFLHRDEERGWICSCPTAPEKRTGGCKHEVAFRAVCMASKMEREAAAEERRKGAEEIRRDQPADEEEIERRFRERLAAQKEMDRRFPPKRLPEFVQFGGAA